MELCIHLIEIRYKSATLLETRTKTPMLLTDEMMAQIELR